MAVELEFDPKVFRITAVKKAAYRFLNQLHTHIWTRNDGTIVASLSFGNGDPNDILQKQFRDEVLDQDLREVIGEETASIRNLILAQAFSQTSLVDPVGDTADFRNDSMGIAKPDSDQS